MTRKDRGGEQGKAGDTGGFINCLDSRGGRALPEDRRGQRTFLLRNYPILFPMANPVPEIMPDLARKDLNPDYIIPNPFDSRVVKAVAAAVAEAARTSGAAEK